MTKAATPEQIHAKLAEQKTITDRLQAQADSISHAEREAYRTTELSVYRREHGPNAVKARNARDAAKDKLDALAAAEKLDLRAIADAFVDLRDADARAGAQQSHGARLNHIDPIRPNFIGAPQSRPPQVTPLYERTSFWAYLDSILTARYERIRSQRGDELRNAAHAEITAAVDNARAAAAAAAADHE
jgi:hypothetical protein